MFNEQPETQIIPDELYQKIIQALPIPCVDLLVFNNENKLLLLKRKNEPAKGQWWFPGGRVFFGETREKAALRKLNEECGLNGLIIDEFGTYDLLLKKDKSNSISHAITSVYKIQVNNDNVTLDNQSLNYAWKKANEWIKEVEDDFLITILKKIKQ